LSPSQLTDAPSLTPAFTPGRRTRRAQAVSTVYERIRREKQARSQILVVGDLEIAAP